MTYTPGLLSVIMPLYNTGEPFIACMDSLIAQTWKNIEIIIINDGSTDNSAELAQSYADRYPHVHLLHQRNGGVSAARNTGMKVAKGEYIAYVDGDDIAYPENVRNADEYGAQGQSGRDECNADWCIAETGKTWQSIPTDRIRWTGVMTGPDWLRKGLASRRWRHVVWMGVYRHQTIRDAGLSFIPGLHHQDIIWTTEFMFNAKRARYTEVPLYKYFLHDASISRLPRTGLKNLDYQRHYIKITRLLDKMNHDYAGRIPIYPEFKQQVIYEALRVCHCIRKEPDIRERMSCRGGCFGDV
ncbi:glycosyltransferase [Escherichia coli]